MNIHLGVCITCPPHLQYLWNDTLSENDCGLQPGELSGQSRRVSLPVPAAVFLPPPRPNPHPHPQDRQCE